jgi:hypothetical protein
LGTSVFRTLAKEQALAEPDTKYVDPEERQREEICVLSHASRDSLKHELLWVLIPEPGEFA